MRLEAWQFLGMCMGHKRARAIPEVNDAGKFVPGTGSRVKCIILFTWAQTSGLVMPEVSSGTSLRLAANCMESGMFEHPRKNFQQVFLYLIPKSKEDSRYRLPCLL